MTLDELLQPGSGLVLPQCVRVHGCFRRGKTRPAKSLAKPIRKRPKHSRCVGHKPADQIGTRIAGRRPKVEAERRPLTVHPEADPGQMAIEHDAVDRPAVLFLDHLELGEKSRRVHGRISAVDAVTNERVRDTGRKAAARQSNPEVPVFTEPISFVKATPRQRFLSDQDGRTAAGNAIEPMERARYLLRCSRRRTTEDAMIVRHVHRACIRPGSSRRSNGLELKP